MLVVCRFAIVTKRVNCMIGCTIPGFTNYTATSSFAESIFGSSTKQDPTIRLSVLARRIVGCNFEFAGYCRNINLTSSTPNRITDHTTGNCFSHTLDCNCNFAELEELVLHPLLQNQSSLLHRLRKLVSVVV